MSTLNITNIQTTTASWYVSGLSNPFTTTYYRSVILSSEGGAGTSGPSTYFSSVSPYSAGSTTSTTTPTGSISGMTANTTYTVYAYAQAASDGAYYSAGSATFTTAKQKLTTPSLSITGTTSNSINYQISAVTGASYYYVEIFLNGVSKGLNGSSSLTGSFTGLSPNTTYTLSVYATGTGYLDSDKSSTTATTNNAPSLSTPVFSSTSSTSGTITATINAVPNAISYIWNISSGGSITGTSTTVTFNNLTPNTTYTIQCQAHGDGVNYSDSAVSSTTATTKPAPALTTPNAPSVVNISYSQAMITWNGVVDASSYDVQILDSSNSVVFNSNTTGTTMNVTGLNVYTSYKSQVKAKGNGVTYFDSSWSSLTNFSTLNYPDPPVIDTNQTQKGDKQISLQWSGRINCTYTLQYKLHTDTTWTTAISGLNSTGYTITGLTNGVQYDFRVNAYASEINYTTGWSGVVTGTPGLRPLNFDWDNIKSQGQPVNVTATEWNKFTTRINDFRTYKSLSKLTFTTANKDSNITASIVNEAINAINTMGPTSSGPSLASGIQTQVTAVFFNSLRDSLNSIQ